MEGEEVLARCRCCSRWHATISSLPLVSSLILSPLAPTVYPSLSLAHLSKDTCPGPEASGWKISLTAQRREALRNLLAMGARREGHLRWVEKYIPTSNLNFKKSVYLPPVTKRLHGISGADQMNGLTVKSVGHDVCTHSPRLEFSFLANSPRWRLRLFYRINVLSVLGFILFTTTVDLVKWISTVMMKYVKWMRSVNIMIILQMCLRMGLVRLHVAFLGTPCVPGTSG